MRLREEADISFARFFASITPATAPRAELMTNAVPYCVNTDRSRAASEMIFASPGAAPANVPMRAEGDSLAP